MTPAPEKTAKGLPKLKVTHRFDAIDFKTVSTWLSAEYWVPGITEKRVRSLARHSLVLAALIDSRKRVYAYGRAVSDGSRFAYMADIIVHPDWRGAGLGKRLVQSLLDHPKVRDVDLWLLQTRDAHGLYRPFGFHPLEFPERVLVRRRGQVSQQVAVPP